MGLDMFMSKRTYVKQWWSTPEDKLEVVVTKGGKTFSKIKPERVSYIIEEVGYWRKFNALHNWFVNNCGDGYDDCKEIYIGDKLPELLETLKEVKRVYEGDNLDKFEALEELFPTTTGFFFGSTEYDKYYIENVNETIELIESLIKEDEEGTESEYYYRSSW